jgi:hypothetical protein
MGKGCLRRSSKPASRGERPKVVAEAAERYGQGVRSRLGALPKARRPRKALGKAKATAGGSRSDPKAKPIWEMFDEAMRKLPEEELRKLPHDGAEQHDHYIYGTPKKRQ